MEKYVKKLEFSNEELKNLPLFFKVIYFNDVTNIEDEIKLFKYNKKLQTNYMRHFDPNRVVCKSFNTEIFKDDDY